MSGYEIVTASVHSGNLGAGLMLTALATCPTGMRPLGGGVQTVNALHLATVSSSYPDAATPSWVGEIRNGSNVSAGATDIIVSAICARVQ